MPPKKAGSLGVGAQISSNRVGEFRTVVHGITQTTTMVTTTTTLNVHRDMQCKVAFCRPPSSQFGIKPGVEEGQLDSVREFGQCVVNKQKGRSRDDVERRRSRNKVSAKKSRESRRLELDSLRAQSVIDKQEIRRLTSLNNEMQRMLNGATVNPVRRVRMVPSGGVKLVGLSPLQSFSSVLVAGSMEPPAVPVVCQSALPAIALETAAPVTSAGFQSLECGVDDSCERGWCDQTRGNDTCLDFMPSLGATQVDLPTSEMADLSSPLTSQESWIGYL